MNSYWVTHAGSENHRKTTKSLKICYLFNINQERVYHTKTADVDELKRLINSEWTAVSHRGWQSFFETRCRSNQIFPISVPR